MWLAIKGNQEEHHNFGGPPEKDEPLCHGPKTVGMVADPFGNLDQEFSESHDHWGCFVQCEPAEVSCSSLFFVRMVFMEKPGDQQVRLISRHNPTWVDRCRGTIFFLFRGF